LRTLSVMGCTQLDRASLAQLRSVLVPECRVLGP
jgi:hypothetical protein